MCSRVSEHSSRYRCERLTHPLLGLDREIPQVRKSSEPLGLFSSAFEGPQLVETKFMSPRPPWKGLGASCSRLIGKQAIRA